MSKEEENVPGFLETMRREPLLAIIGAAFWVGVVWWAWSTVTYQDIAIEDRQYCSVIAGIASQAADERGFVDQRSFIAQLRRDFGNALPQEALNAVDLAYHNTLMEPSELRDRVERQCLRRFREADDNT